MSKTMSYVVMFLMLGVLMAGCKPAPVAQTPAAVEQHSAAVGTFPKSVTAKIGPAEQVGQAPTRPEIAPPTPQTPPTYVPLPRATQAFVLPALAGDNDVANPADTALKYEIDESQHGKISGSCVQSAEQEPEQLLVGIKFQETGVWPDTVLPNQAVYCMTDVYVDSGVMGKTVVVAVSGNFVPLPDDRIKPLPARSNCTRIFLVSFPGDYDVNLQCRAYVALAKAVSQGYLPKDSVPVGIK